MERWRSAVEEMVVNRHFWNDKRVLITGHTGFKGSWLCLWLQSLGVNVSGYSLPPPTNPSHFDISRVGDEMQSHIGDVRNLESLKQIVSRTRPEIVFHLAAQPLVRYSYTNPVETYATNVLGTVHLFEAVRAVSGVHAVIVVTSDKCYDNREWVWGYREDDPIGGYDPYSSSKGCAELVTAAYRSAFFGTPKDDERGVAVASVRAGNVIGGGDWAEDRLIPDVIRAFTSHRPVEIRNPNAIRPWQHVLEPLSGYLRLAERLCESGSAWAEAWNFGPGEDDTKTVEWVVRRATEIWGGDASWRADPGSHPHEARSLRLDTSKARSRMKWKPRWNLDHALQATFEWYLAHERDDDMHAYTISQIQKYEQTQLPN